MEQKRKGKLKRIEKAINQIPEFKNQVKTCREMIITQVLSISQKNDVFSIHIRLGANPLLIAKLVNHLSRRFDLGVGIPCFLSEDCKTMFWGEEAMMAYEEFCQNPFDEQLRKMAIEQYDLENFESSVEN